MLSRITPHGPALWRGQRHGIPAIGLGARSRAAARPRAGDGGKLDLVELELAGERLERVLMETRGDTVLDEVETYTATQRLTLLANLGTGVTTLALAFCWCGQQDPLGGLTLSESSLHAAALGAAFGLPLLACSAAGHSAPAKRAFPVLDELHSVQREVLAPLLAGMSPGQLVALNACFVLPSLLFLLPGFKGGCTALESWVSSAVLTPQLIGAAPPGAAAAAAAAVAPHLPWEVELLAPSVLSAYTAGFLVASCLAVRRKEVSAVREALKNADRFFRLQIAERRGARAAAAAGGAGGAGGSAVGGSGAQGAAAAASSDQRGRGAAAAFRLVACCWLLERVRVSRLAFVLASLNVVYLSMVWMATWDLATPAVAAGLHFAFECYLSQSEQRAADEQRRERIAARGAAARARREEAEASGGSD